MSDLTPAEDQMVAAVVVAARKSSIPIRNPAYIDPSWWSYPLNVTKTRPIPANSGWLNYLDINTNVGGGLVPTGHVIRLKGYVASGQYDPVVSGLRYRFLESGRHMPDQEFDITDSIERHLERNNPNQFPHPFPCFHRRIVITLNNDSRLTLQVNNTSGTVRLAFASLYGYYYPNLLGLSKGGQEAPPFTDEDGSLEDDGRF